MLVGYGLLRFTLDGDGIFAGNDNSTDDGELVTDQTSAAAGKIRLTSNWNNGSPNVTSILDNEFAHCQDSIRHFSGDSLYMANNAFAQYLGFSYISAGRYAVGRDNRQEINQIDKMKLVVTGWNNTPFIVGETVQKAGDATIFGKVIYWNGRYNVLYLYKNNTLSAYEAGGTFTLGSWSAINIIGNTSGATATVSTAKIKELGGMLESIAFGSIVDPNYHTDTENMCNVACSLEKNTNRAGFTVINSDLNTNIGRKVVTSKLVDETYFRYSLRYDGQEQYGDGVNPPHSYYITKRIQTTDATATVIWNRSCAEGKVIFVEALVSSAKLDASDKAFYQCRAVCSRLVGGGGVLDYDNNGSNVIHESAGWAASVSVSFVVNGNTLELKVTGIAVTNIDWVANIQYMYYAPVELDDLGS